MQQHANFASCFLASHRITDIAFGVLDWTVVLLFSSCLIDSLMPDARHAEAAAVSFGASRMSSTQILMH